MLEDQLTIYVDRLHGGEVENFNFSLEPSVIVRDEDACFAQPIEVDGEAYLSGDYLVVVLSLKSQVLVPCKICNEDVEISIALERVYSMEELAGISHGIFGIGQLIRELVLSEVPQFVECSGGSCPNRDEMSRYMKRED